MSDLHAGATTSLITHIAQDLRAKTGLSSPTSDALGRALRPTLAEFSDQPEPDLVLMGDVLDLSLSKPEDTTAVFETFVKSVICGEKDEASAYLSDQVVFLPGNHDHSLWTALRYQTERFVDDARKVRDFRGSLERFAQVTPAFNRLDERLESSLLAQIFAAGGKDCKVPTYYPNLGYQSPDGTRAVVMHHGHFIESMYRLLSIIAAGFRGEKCGPMDAATLERENGNWIDFGWSTVGENGPIGSDVASIYQFLLTGSEEGRLQSVFADQLADNLMKLLPLPQTNQIMEGVKIVAKGIIDATVGKFSQTERLSYTSYLGHSSVEGLGDYLTGAVHKQMMDELVTEQRKPFPETTSFVFGHTHKPFEDEFLAEGFDAPVNVYNTGGWILDTSLLGTKEGASIIFIDDDAHVASLRAFNSPLNGVPSKVAVNGLGEVNPMRDALAAAVAKHQGLWDRFSKVVAEEMQLRQRVILKLTADADRKSGPAKVTYGV